MVLNLERLRLLHEQVVQGYNDWKYGEGELYYVSGDIVDGKPVLAKASSLSEQDTFVNGILNEDPAYAATLGLKQTGGKPFVMLHNPSNGVISDLVESGLGKLAGPSNIARQLAGLLQKGTEARIYAHSQGAIITTNAMEILASKSYKFDNGLQVTFNGGAVNYEAAGRVISSVGGSLDPISRQNAHRFDLVPQVVGGNGGLLEILGSILISPALFMGPNVSPHTVYEP